jgi:hypothetical protein
MSLIGHRADDSWFLEDIALELSGMDCVPLVIASLQSHNYRRCITRFRTRNTHQHNEMMLGHSADENRDTGVEQGAVETVVGRTEDRLLGAENGRERAHRGSTEERSPAKTGHACLSVAALLFALQRALKIFHQVCSWEVRPDTRLAFGSLLACLLACVELPSLGVFVRTMRERLPGFFDTLGRAGMSVLLKRTVSRVSGLLKCFGDSPMHHLYGK